MMENETKKICKIAGAACAATSIIAVSALVASGAAVGALAEGFKAAGNAMKKILEEQKNESANASSASSNEVEETNENEQ